MIETDLQLALFYDFFAVVFNLLSIFRCFIFLLGYFYIATFFIVPISISVAILVTTFVGKKRKGDITKKVMMWQDVMDNSLHYQYIWINSIYNILSEEIEIRITYQAQYTLIEILPFFVTCFPATFSWQSKEGLLHMTPSVVLLKLVPYQKRDLVKISEIR